MAQLESSLGNIEAGLRRLGRSIVLERLQPGVSSDAVRQRLAPLGLAGNDELVALYSWRDGIDTSISDTSIEKLCLFPDSYMTPLEHSVVDYQEFTKGDRWNPNWFPLFPDGGGDFYALEISGQEAGNIRQFWVDEEEAPILYESLSSMLASVAAAYRAGLYFVSKDGWISIDDDQYASIAAHHNPTIEWWKPATE